MAGTRISRSVVFGLFLFLSIGLVGCSRSGQDDEGPGRPSPSVEAVLTPGSVSASDPGELELRVTMRGFSQSAPVASVSLPEGREPGSIPFALDESRATVIGAGRIGSIGSGVYEGPVECIVPHGFSMEHELQAASFYLAGLRADQSSTLVIPVKSSPHLRFSPTDDTVVDVSVGSSENARDSVKDSTSALVLEGTTGVKLTLDDPGMLSVGKPVQVTGTMNPATPGQRGQFRVTYPGSNHFSAREAEVVATFGTAEDGSFTSSAWTPRSQGRHFLWATRSSSARDRTPDWSCPVLVTVEK